MRCKQENNKMISHVCIPMTQNLKTHYIVRIVYGATIYYTRNTWMASWSEKATIRRSMVACVTSEQLENRCMLWYTMSVAIFVYRCAIDTCGWKRGSDAFDTFAIKTSLSIDSKCIGCTRRWGQTIMASCIECVMECALTMQPYDNARCDGMRSKFPYQRSSLVRPSCHFFHNFFSLLPSWRLWCFVVCDYMRQHIDECIFHRD